MPGGFRMGDYEFWPLDASGPIEREPRRQPILGAPPPRHLAGFLREASVRNPSAAAGLLIQQRFCGHNEPTYSVFDLITNPTSPWKMCYKEREQALHTLDVSPVGGGPWLRVFDRDWFNIGNPVVELPQSPVLIERSDGELVRAYEDDTAAYDIAFGFEYPAQCMSSDDVSWFALAVAAQGRAPIQIVSEELM